MSTDYEHGAGDSSVVEHMPFMLKVQGSITAWVNREKRKAGSCTCHNAPPPTHTHTSPLSRVGATKSGLDGSCSCCATLR